MKDKLQIRNSTTEFLIFQIDSKADGVEVLYQDEMLWLTQDVLLLFFLTKAALPLQSICKISSIVKNYRKIQFVGNSDELPQMAKSMPPNTISGCRLSVGYRANSVRATQFR